MENYIALVGLGAVGAPIAHRLYKQYKNRFVVLSDADHKKKLDQICEINGEFFKPVILTDRKEFSGKIGILLITVKNYDLLKTLDIVDQFIDSDTVVVPLQNGIWSCRYLRNKYSNVVAECYVRGPDTKKIQDGFEYTKSGVVHIGTSNPQDYERVYEAYTVLKNSGMDIHFEEDIQRMLWRKWMLNVAGNTVTALTGANYKMFSESHDLQAICLEIMHEFMLVSDALQIGLTEEDVNETIAYFVGFQSEKITSMLEDVINEKRTENEYITGELLRLAEENAIDLPINRTMYELVKIKEYVYTTKKNEQKRSASEKAIIKTSVQKHMSDIKSKLENNDIYCYGVREKTIPELENILNYAVGNSQYYASLFAGQTDLKLSDFPVMNRTVLNQCYDSILVGKFNSEQTHFMYSSGSNGIPFSVVQDMGKRDRNIADLKYFGETAGYKDHDSLCYLRAKPMVSYQEQKEQNIWQLDISNLTEDNLLRYFDVMCEKGCTAIMAYPSTLEIAVDVWSSHVSNTSSVTTIITTSEKLDSEIRDKLRCFFGKGVRIVARYSNSENGVLAQESSEGIYAVNWGSYYVEVLKMDSNEAAASGEMGRVVVTDLYNLAFPIIRYDTGDIARMIYPESGMPYLTDISGRLMDMIFDIHGDMVSPHAIVKVMRLAKSVEQWQFIQRSKTEYILKVTVTHGDDPCLDNEIIKLKDILGYSADIIIDYIRNEPIKNAQQRKLTVFEMDEEIGYGR